MTITKPDLVTAIKNALSLGAYSIIWNRGLNLSIIPGDIDEQGVQTAVVTEHGSIAAEKTIRVTDVFTGLKDLEVKHTIMITTRGRIYIVLPAEVEGEVVVYEVVSVADVITKPLYRRDIVRIKEPVAEVRLLDPLPTTTTKTA